MNHIAAVSTRFDSQDAFNFQETYDNGSLLNATLREKYNPEAQMSAIQIEAVAAAIRSRGPKCNVLVFGLGNDSPLWAELNKDGYTLFLENIPQWISKMKGLHPQLNVEQMNYPTTVGASLKDPRSIIQNAKVPDILLGHKWDVILVDGPMGYTKELPGRALPIIWAAQLSTDSTHVFIDDYERDLEQSYGDFLFGGRKANRSVVLPRPATPRLNASKMLWLFGISEALSAAMR